MSFYISKEHLLHNRNLIKSNTSNKIDTFVGIVVLLLNSEKLSEYYYKSNTIKLSNDLNSAFTLKNTNEKTNEKYWYALFTPDWANRSLTHFLSNKKVNINVLLSTIYWKRERDFIQEQKEKLKTLIGTKNFSTLFNEESVVEYDNHQPITIYDIIESLNIDPSSGNLTIKYDGSLISKDAGELSSSAFSQTLYTSLEIKKIINIFEFNIVSEFEVSEIFNINQQTPTTPKKAKNLLLYGVAGSGKSHAINKIIGNSSQYTERIVFHPDYLNTDFIGQIMPIMQNNQIIYDFKIGPFTKILKKAINDHINHYYLVIEEINRGNAPAIFGEIFQLLDRNENGESSYRISHEMIAKAVFDDENKAIFIPNNLTILATMNTADQNVFTLDTAFQRRWTMRMIENHIDECHYKDEFILDTGITWGVFNTVINDFILEVNKDTLSSEDKRLGAYFIRQDELKKPTPNNIEEGTPFSEKVIKYLWDDVFKFNKYVLFDSEFNSLDKTLKFFNNNEKISRFDIFNEDVRNKLKQGINLE